ncbi:nucleotidyltransferase domain-containing protein [Enterobacter roggenkampii]|uniref:nucleotidyltransferase domain-containing protein n=4 Tax=Enterobacter roggenkampii TaxID=1812935 RepID=UPI0003BEB774|nr:nucleotidyltransferase domain-containing protein [Enterobacter roggenkampii]EKS7398198.1 nucleotidyltransferase domain-containing protein [Enterobacter roggenkampii]EKU9173531.1 nucleotidyltransferase domain-containing protein [Enterobacter roggenkampii MGH 34]EKU9556526.1 nucleotidyltransferase domain-containing protein [Enterobacter roggenkampii MGH 34]EKW7739572.1 nucleotidyltransferase domain-containing protein [Enterobacter roggenkampii]EKY4004684.1 nucleotidyltransferase domain-contai
MKNIIDNISLDCLVVIGSHARGDDDRHSDVDLLGIVENSPPEMINVKKINLAIYSEHDMSQMMQSGNLFALHIVNEGIPLTNELLFKKLCTCFTYKDSYAREKKVAYLMGSMILGHRESITNWAVVNKRIAWCVRTYILSLMAEKRTPMFSKNEIAFFGSNAHNELSYADLLELINAKQISGYSENIFNTFIRFMNSIIYCQPSVAETNIIFNEESILQHTFDRMQSNHYR